MKLNTNIIIHMLIIVFIRIIIAVTGAERVTFSENRSCIIAAAYQKSNSQLIPKQQSTSHSQLPQLICWEWHSMVLNIPLATSCHRHWPWSLPPLCATPHWQSMANWKVLDLGQALSGKKYQFLIWIQKNPRHCTSY